MTWFEKIIPSRIKTARRTRSVPEGLWIKCEACDAVLYRAELERNLNVCPKCSHHMRIDARERLKRFLEMRGADNGPCRTICSLSALWVGLLYDAQAQAEAAALIADWTQQERAHLRATVPRMGLDTPFRGQKLQLVAQQVVAIAKGGLQRRGLNEAPFLRNLEDIAASGKSLADQMLDAYPGWGKGGVDACFERYTF